ncbi:MAG: hypothetical protein RBU37_22485, partial [Myxococcota bacterium]|nr:hypothetical protein [Myxococcota bacterium]
RRYVEAGNYLYASDWAFYFVETAFPEKIDFRGEDLRPIDVLTGARGLHVVSIVDPEMRAFTGMSLATIDLNLTQWAVPVDVSADTKVYLRGDARLTTGAIETDIPYLVDFRYGSGSVAYTSYHIHQNQAIDVFFAFIAMNFK